jgi:hypothetical protein
MLAGEGRMYDPNKKARAEIEVATRQSRRSEPIVKLPRKKRYPDRPYRRWDFDKSSKKSF